MPPRPTQGPAVNWKTVLFRMWLAAAGVWSAWILIRAFENWSNLVGDVFVDPLPQAWQLQQLSRSYDQDLAINAGLLVLPWAATAVFGAFRAYRRSRTG